MNILKISLDDNADLPFIKKLLSQIKGISNIEFTKDEDETLSEQEENEVLDALLNKSLKQSDDGMVKELKPEYLKKMFTK